MRSSLIDDIGAAFADIGRAVGHELTILDWNTGANLAAAFPEHMLFSPPRGVSKAELPYVDRSINVVVLDSHKPRLVAEAVRVATDAVICIDWDRRPKPTVAVQWRAPRRVAWPELAIVIPVHNGERYLVDCLEALVLTLPEGYPWSVTVVDDGSTDDSGHVAAKFAREFPGFRLISNRTNAGYLDTCMRGAQETASEILLFLNQDTVPLAGWYEAMMAMFMRHADVGVVTAKLLSPNGRLQEAGAVIFQDGTGANIGRGADPTDSLFCFARDVDYGSGAALATRRTVFAQLNGFDPRFRPAYYEDTDYCFRARHLGWRVVYQPDAAFVHVEGSAYGRDPHRGGKHYQTIHRETFRQRWQEQLSQQPSPPNSFTERTWIELSLVYRPGHPRH